MAYPSYPQYPGSEAAIPQSRPPAPPTVRNAFFCMLGGAVWEVVGLVVTLTQKNSIHSELQTKFPSDTPDKINTLTNAAIVEAVVAVIIGIGLWIWMAFVNRAGKNWARITGTVFFGISTLSVIIDVAAGSSGMGGAKSTTAQVVVAVIGWLIGLAAVLLLWNKASGPYFKRQNNPYAQAPYPEQYPQPGQPYLGDQPPANYPPQNPPPPQ
ncbi:MAG TPA: hypothetical protein VGM10_11725 [Actinocrinis sp.]|jgi:hypothetical protein